MIESGYAPNSEGAGPEAAGDAIGATFASAVGCSGSALLSCLRSASLTAIMNESESPTLGDTTAFTWFPIVDDYVLSDYPVRRILNGTFNKVPTLLGTNENEGTLFVLTSPPTDPASFISMANVSFPGNGAAVATEYPVVGDAGAPTPDGGLPLFATYEAAAAQALTDGAFVCPARQIARALTSAGVPTYRYEFTHAIDLGIPNLGVFHGSELEFVFGNLVNSLAPPITSAEGALSTNMMGYWGAMARSGSPNGGGRLMWPVYSMATEPDLVLDLALSTETELEKAQCDFWDALPTTP